MEEAKEASSVRKTVEGKEEQATENTRRQEDEGRGGKRASIPVASPCRYEPSKEEKNQESIIQSST